MDELISVVITTYGRISELKRAIESIINQTYQNLEIIIVDDNVDLEISRQLSLIIKEFKDNRLIYIKNEKNLGGALSRNVGIEKANGKYIAFLDDDDEYLPQKVEKQYNLFKETTDKRLALVYCYCEGIKDGKITDHYNYNYTGNCLYQAMKGCIAATSQWMCKKDYLENVGCFSDVPCKQDSTVIIKLLVEGYTINRVPEILSLYHEEDIPRISSKNAKKRIVGETKLLELCRRNYDKITKQQAKEVEYTLSCNLILYYLEINDKNNYKIHLKNIIKTHPFKKQTFKIYFRILKKKIKKFIKK